MSSCAIEENGNANINHITEEDIKQIISKYATGNEQTNIENYSVHIASNKMLGFLAEYWKIKVHLSNHDVLYFFVKAISRSNAAKADMVREMNLFNKEMRFYSEIKKFMETPGIEAWSPKLITVLNDAVVFEDLNAMGYKLNNKFDRFDMPHTLTALKALARFHASSIILEETKKRQTIGHFINDEFEHVLDRGGYKMSNTWYTQCMTGTLEAIKKHSKYDETQLKDIQSHWYDVWSSVIDLSNFDPERRNVICHRDLWNNNIMFHYDKDQQPDSCMFVDFQAVRYQPPASDVVLLLCCNLDPTFRKENMGKFLNFYYDKLQKILANCNVDINNVMSEKEFLTSADEQMKWGLVLCACLLPQIWLDDDLITEIFCDNAQFDEIMCKNKGQFIIKMMANNFDYKQKVMEIYEELIDKYCFTSEL